MNEAARDEDDGDQAVCGIKETDGLGVSVEEASTNDPSKLGEEDPLDGILRGLLDQDLEAGPATSTDVMFESQDEAVEPERDAPSVSPSSLMDTFGPSISSLSSSSSPFTHLQNDDFSSFSSSSSSAVCLTPPLPPSVGVPAVLTDTRLTLDVYQGGAAALPLLWQSIPKQVRGIQYLRLGSEDKQGLDDALDVIPNLTELRSLTIRGNFFINSMVNICHIVLLTF